MINLNEIELDYQRRGQIVPAIRGVSLSVAAGSFVAIQGASGAGKSSLLLVAGGLLRSRGQVMIDGHEIYKQTREQRAKFRARNIGYIFQRFHLLPYLTVRQNILAPTLAIPFPAGSHRADQLLSQFALQHRADHLPAQLSVGECQRVATARALMVKPKVILADEPTGNLDRDNSQSALDAIRWAVDEGAAAILVTHDHQSAARADRVLNMRDGRFQ